MNLYVGIGQALDLAFHISCELILILSHDTYYPFLSREIEIQRGQETAHGHTHHKK